MKSSDDRDAGRFPDQHPCLQLQSLYGFGKQVFAPISLWFVTHLKEDKIYMTNALKTNFYVPT